MMTIEETMATCVLFGRAIDEDVHVSMKVQSNDYWLALAAPRKSGAKECGSMAPAAALQAAASWLASYGEEKVSRASGARSAIGRAAYLEAKHERDAPVSAPSVYVADDELLASCRRIGSLVAPLLPSWRITLFASARFEIIRRTEGRQIEFSAKLDADGEWPLDVWGFGDDGKPHHALMDALNQLELVVERGVAGRVAWLKEGEREAMCLLAKLQAG